MKIKQLLENRETAEDKLAEYYHIAETEDKELFISYTNINKIGINPQSVYNTPIGIYCYPLKAAFVEYDLGSDVSKVPYAGDGANIWVIESKATKVFDTKAYSASDFKTDAEVLFDFISRWISKGATFSWDGDALNKREVFNDLVRTAMSQAIVATPAGKMWNLTRMIAGIIADAHRNTETVWWNALFNKLLGYQGVIDRGEGVIHESEPLQAVFFSKSYFDVVDLIRNTSTSKTVHKINKDLRNLINSVNLAAKQGVDLDDVLEKVLDIDQYIYGEIPDQLDADVDLTAVNKALKKMYFNLIVAYSDQYRSGNPTEVYAELLNAPKEYPSMFDEHYAVEAQRLLQKMNQDSD